MRSRALFGLTGAVPAADAEAERQRWEAKVASEYAPVRSLPAVSFASASAAPEAVEQLPMDVDEPAPAAAGSAQAAADGLTAQTPVADSSRALVSVAGAEQRRTSGGQSQTSTALSVVQRKHEDEQPEWHAPWKLMRVISGHVGWVRCVAVDVSNEWFVTGSADRTIKIWDLASGQLKLTLTGHISTVRAVIVSDRHPYLFSVGEDKSVKCWDLEQNKVVRHYHGHLSGVYCAALHPQIDVLMTGGRDSSVRVWDIRTKSQVHCMTGHTNTVASLMAQSTDPQVISGSADSTVRLWDLAAGKSMAVLTNHKKGVRALASSQTEYSFVSGAADNLKKWKLPEGRFLHNLSGHNAVVNALAVNRDGVLVSGADNGSMHLWDWRTGHNFQQIQTQVQPGSLESEAGVFAMAFDQTGSRLITCEADKTIKIWKEDPDATPETHPLNWRPSLHTKRWQSEDLSATTIAACFVDHRSHRDCLQ